MHIWIRRPPPSWKPGTPTRWKQLGTVISLVVPWVPGKPPYGSITQCCYQRGSTTQSLPNYLSFGGGKSFVLPFSELAMGLNWLKNNSRNVFLLARFVFWATSLCDCKLLQGVGSLGMRMSCWSGKRAGCKDRRLQELLLERLPKKDIEASSCGKRNWGVWMCIWWCGGGVCIEKQLSKECL